METTQNATNAMAMENKSEFMRILFDLQKRVEHRTGEKFNTPALLGYVYQAAAGTEADPRVLQNLEVDKIDYYQLSENEVNRFVQFGNELVDYVLGIRRYSMRYAALLSDELPQLVMNTFMHVTDKMTVYLPFAGIAPFVDACPNATYVGEEMDEKIWALCKIRAFFRKQNNVRIALADSMDRYEKYDTIVAMPPFGMRGAMSMASIIESLYARLNDGGLMAVVVPAGFLTETSVQATKVKRMLLEQHALYGVELLPGDLFANTSVSVAVLLIQRNGGDVVSLTDYSEFVRDNRKYGSLCKLDLEAIDDAEKTQLFRTLRDTYGSDVFTEEPLDMESKERFRIRIKHEDLLREDMIDLNPKFHINRAKVLSRKEQGETLTPLKDIVDIYARANLMGGGVSVPVVRIQDLADSILKGTKDFLDLEIEERKERNLPLLMEDNLLLVALVGKKLKPTIFKLTEGHQIVYSENIAPLQLKSSLVSLEYLQSELASDFVMEQVAAHHMGGGRQSISRQNLLNLMIRIPDHFEQQEKSVEKRKEELSAELIQKLGIENEELRNARYNEFVREMRVRKHAIGQVLNELSPAIDMLLICKDKNNGVLRGSDIVSKRSGYTVDEYLQKVRSLVNKVVYMVDSLTNEYKPKGEVKEYNVVQLIEEYFQNHSITNGFDVSIKHETFNNDLHVPAGIELPDGSITEEINISAGDNMDFWTIAVCKEDFFQVLDNIISNAQRYGFTENRPDYTIRFEMEDVRDDKQPMVAIHIKNNGNPLPEGIKPEQVFMYGEGSAQGTGIGGWQIKQIVEGMGGKVELRTYDKDEAGYTIDYVLTFPDKSVVVFA